MRAAEARGEARVSWREARVDAHYDCAELDALVSAVSRLEIDGYRFVFDDLTDDLSAVAVILKRSGVDPERFTALYHLTEGPGVQGLYGQRFGASVRIWQLQAGACEPMWDSFTAFIESRMQSASVATAPPESAPAVERGRPERPEGDLFSMLVRLELAGWKSSPGMESDSVPSELQRLIKKCGTLVAPDGRVFDLTGVDGPTTPLGGEGVAVRCIQAETGVYLTFVGDQVRVWQVSAPLEVVALAESLGAWLADLSVGREPVGLVDPTALSDLDEVGDGVGWRLDELVTPTRLGPVTDFPEGARYRLDGELLWVGDRVQALDDFVTDTVPAPDEPDVDPELAGLFGEEGARPRPRTLRILLLLVFGLSLTVLGMACIAAPGGILVLLAWMVVETDQRRLETGYLPKSDAPVVARMRTLTFAGLVVVVFLFILQGFLLCNGAYDVLLDNVYIPWWREFVRGFLEGSATAV